MKIIQLFVTGCVLLVSGCAAPQPCQPERLFPIGEPVFVDPVWGDGESHLRQPTGPLIGLPPAVGPGMTTTPLVGPNGVVLCNTVGEGETAFTVCN